MPAPIEDRTGRVLDALRGNQAALIADLVKRTGMSRSTVQRAIRELEQAGKLTRIPRLGKSPLYVVTA